MDNKNNKLHIPITELLKLAKYQFDFSNLARGFMSYYEKEGTGYLNIIKKRDTDFYLMFSPTEWKSENFNEDFSDFLKDKELNANHPTLLLNYPLFLNSIANHVIYSIMVNNEIISLLVFSYDTEEEAMKNLNDYEDWVTEFIKILQHGYLHEQYVQEDQRRDILLQVMKKFHSTMNVGEVLESVVEAIENSYPTYNVNLLLSQEWEVSDELSIKPLNYGTGSGNKTIEHAYQTGQIQIDSRPNEESTTILAPLRGKQGVYGVMEIITLGKIDLPKYEIEFIQMLADTGGMALENAELYQQSRNLIHDLQLINETSHQLNESLRLTDSIKFMTHQIIESFQAEHVGFIMFDDSDQAIILDGSTSYFTELESISTLDPFIHKMKQDKDAVYIGNTDEDDEIYLDTYKSALIIPMIQNNHLRGMVLTLHSQPYHFTFEDFKLLQSLIHHSTLSFMNSRLHEELEALVKTDYLTKLFTRSYLDERIELSMNEDARGTFLLLDIDNFKTINDRYGHQVGDEIIIKIASIMKRAVRDEDIVARWGGEELAIYIPHIGAERGKEIAAHIVEKVANQTNPRVTVSIGVAQWCLKDDFRSLKRLFNLADEGLYEAKKNGKNRVVLKIG